jgi:hypothetical protein
VLGRCGQRRGKLWPSIERIGHRPSLSPSGERSVAVGRLDLFGDDFEARELG